MTIHRVRCVPGRLAALVISTLFALSILGAPKAHADSSPTESALWVADGAISEFAHKSLKKTGTPQPKTRLTDDGLAQGIQFDRHGDLWGLFINFGADESNLIFEMTPRDIREYESSHVISPTVSISNSCSPLSFGQGFKLDPSGNVWFVCSNLIPGSPQQIFEYTKKQFGPSVSPEPAVSIVPSGVTYIGSIQFDPSGNLWMAGGIADQSGSVIMKLSRDQLMSSGTPAPTLVITTPDPTDSPFPVAMAFDEHGNLWFVTIRFPVPTIGFTNKVESFEAKRLSGTGTITLPPAVMLDLSLEDIPLMFDLAFDQGGNLWLGGGFEPPDTEILKLTAKQLRKSAPVKPSVTLMSDDKGDNLGVVRSLIFGPRR